MITSRSAIKKYNNEMTLQLQIHLNQPQVDFFACMEVVLKGADPNIFNRKGDTLLHMAVSKKKQLDCIPELLEFGANPSIKNRSGLTALQCLGNSYMFDNQFPLALALLRYGADPNTLMKDGKTLLHKCIQSCKFEMIDILLQFGVNPSIKDEAGKTALQYLLRWSHRRLESVKLVCAGADLKTTDEEGRTLEGHFLAAKRDLFEFVATEQPELLLDLQARHLLPDNPDKIVKILLDNDRHDMVVALLLSYDTPKLVNSKNETVLQASLQKQPSILLSLFKLGYDPAEIVEGQPLLKQLLSNTCQINPDDRIQLALACMQHGADINTTNENDQTILDIIYQQYPAMIGELEQYAPRLFDAVRPEDVFKAIPIPDLRLQLKYLALAHQVQNNILNFLILLASATHSSLTVFPVEVIAYIINFLPLKEGKRSLKDTLNLMDFIYNNVDEVKKMLGTPGGVNVCQRKNAGASVFVLFKSAENCSQYYYDERRREQDWFQPVEWKKKTSVAEKREHGLNCWKDHLSIFNNPHARLALIERVEEAELYREIKPASRKGA